jgi:hypothetical protein
LAYTGTQKGQCCDGKRYKSLFHEAHVISPESLKMVI